MLQQPAEAVGNTGDRRVAERTHLAFEVVRGAEIKGVLPVTQVMGDRFAKVFSWYDNEWGFSNRMIELSQLVASKL